MRKIIVIAMASLNGFYAGQNGDMSQMGVDDGFNAYNADRIASASTVLVGHTSFKDFSSYWPGRENDSDASENELRFNKRYYDIEKIVVAKQLSSDEVPSGWDGTVRSIDDNVVARIKELKDASGDDIVIWGSRTLWTKLLISGLVDEFHIVYGTGIVNDGVALFDETARPKLTPITAFVINGSSNVAVQYRVE